MVVSGNNDNGTSRNRGPAHWSQLIAGRSNDNPRWRSTIRSRRWIRDAVRRSRQIYGQGRWIRGPLRWTTSQLRVDFNGGIYVADTEDQGFGLDPAMLFPESEVQLSPDSEDKDLAMSCPESETQLCPDSEDKAVEDVALVVPETPEEEWSSFVLPEAAAVDVTAVAVVDPVTPEPIAEQPAAEEEHQEAVEEHLRLKHGSHRRLGNELNGWRRALFDEDKHGSSKKVSKDKELSISDAETDDEGVASWDDHGSDDHGSDAETDDAETDDEGVASWDDHVTFINFVYHDRFTVKIKVMHLFLENIFWNASFMGVTFLSHNYIQDLDSG